MGYSTASSEPWANLYVPSHIAAFIVLSNWPCLSCHLEEELLVEDRCENLRSKISKIPRRSLMSRFEIHRASDAGRLLGFLSGIGGGTSLIHLVLVLAVIILIYNLVTGRRTV
jgi:hypothetical protein